MKTKIALLALLFSAGTLFASAQGGQRRTVVERVKLVMEKITDLKLDNEKTVQSEIIFTDFYNGQDKMREEMMAGGGQPDREKMRETMQKNIAERDEKLKKLWSEDQFKKFKDEIEPALRPQRGGRGNN